MEIGKRHFVRRYLAFSALFLMIACWQKTTLKDSPNTPVGCGCLVFEKLSNEEQDSLMSTVSSKVDSAILVHFKNLRSINDLDSIFELITRCKTSDKTVAPIYFYVVNQLSEKSDGYVGEAITGFYYDFFIEFPECAYSYLQVASQDDHKGFGFNILFEIDANETSDTYLDSAFDAHRARFGSCLAEIDSLESFILKNRN